MEDKFKKVAETPAVMLDNSIKHSERFMKNKYIKHATSYWETLGPGLTTGASDDDPSGIATYSQTGAQYGVQLLWLAGFTFPLMAVVQEMCARIGLITGYGLAASIRKHYSRPVLYACTILLFAANTFNLGAAFLIGRKQANSRFNYGYGKVEDIAGVCVLFLMLASAIGAAYISIERLFHPQPVTHLPNLSITSIHIDPTFETREQHHNLHLH